MAAVEQNGTAQKGLARKTQAETKKQQAETPSAFKSSCQLPNKPLMSRIHRLAAKFAKMAALFFAFCASLYKDFMWFRSALDAEILVSD